MIAFFSMPGGWEWLLITTLMGPICFILPAALLVFLFIKLGPKGRWILGTLLLAPIILLVLFILLRISLSSISPHASSRQVSVSETRTVEGTPPRDLPFEPDVYASKESAVRGVARMLARQYKAMITSQDEVPRTLRISHADNLTGDGGDKASQVKRLKVTAARAVEDVFRPDAPHLDAALTAAPTSKPAGPDTPWQIVLHLSATREPQPADGSEETGIIEGQIVGRLGQYTRQVEYVSKPWRDDFDRWRNSLESTSWVLGESEDFCPSRQESVDQAMRNAVSHVREPVSQQLLQSAKRQPDWLRRQADLYRWLDDEAYRRLKAGDFQTDVFTQEFKRPYGSVWRSAILVHVPPEKAMSMLEAYRILTEAQRVSWLRTAMSGAGLLALIVMVYLFLNMATRGYYVWSVRLATAVLAAFGVWCIVMFVR